jgi:hypothetical protein
MAAHVFLVAVATPLYMTVPAARTPVWAVIGLAGVSAVLVGIRLHRPAHRWPWWALFLWEEGIYVTLAAHPLVPRDRVGFRAQITALNSDEDIDRLNATLTALAGRFRLRPRT